MVVSIANITPNHGSRYYTQEGHRTEPEQQTDSQWWGKLTPALGVGRQVESSSLNSLLHGSSPTGELLLEKTRLHGWQANAKARGEAAPLERAGLDLTTSAPKSVSVQALVFQDRRLEAAHQQATEQMLSFLEERYACTRMTQGGKRQTVLTGQLAIAQFHHDSSRSLDPQLHTHNLILNLQQQPDGQWRSLDNEAIYRAKMLLGKIYRNELALEVQNLGYRIQVTNDRHGLWELQGFTPQQLEHFSKRAQQIQAAAGADANSRKKAWITLTSGRQDKQIVDRSLLVDRWQQEAAQARLQPIQAIPTVPIVFRAEPLVNAALKQITKPIFRREELEHFALLPPGQVSLAQITAVIDQHPGLTASVDQRGHRLYTQGDINGFSGIANPHPTAPPDATGATANIYSQPAPTAAAQFRDELRALAVQYPPTLLRSLAGLADAPVAERDRRPVRGVGSMDQANAQSHDPATAALGRAGQTGGSPGRSPDDPVAGGGSESQSANRDTSGESQPTHGESIAAPHADWDWERERS